MKMIYAVIGLLLIGGLVFYTTSCKNKSQGNGQTVADKVDPKKNPYNDLRNMAFSVTSEQLGIKLPADETKIYGVVMDWDLGNGTATLVSFLSGDASLYLSSGGGFIGGAGHDNIKKAVATFINKAEKFIDKAEKTEKTTLPEKNGLKFYLLTNKGIFVAQEEMKNIENNSSAWLDLFNEGNNLITEIRISSEKN